MTYLRKFVNFIANLKQRQMKNIFCFAAVLLSATVFFSCGPSAYLLDIETRQPSAAGVDLVGKSISVVYLDSGAEEDSLFAAGISSAFADVLDENYFGGDSLEVLVNNAGITRDGLIAMMSEENWDSVISVNLKGAFNMIRHTSRLFIRNKCGRIVNISSVSGLMGNAGQINYSASKAGIVGLTKSTARELASKGVTCNAVAPGFIRTDMTKNITEENSELLKTIPLGRMGEVSDVAAAVVFLLTSPYITGEVLRVDGGIAM